jgi:hypothetical protein
MQPDRLARERQTADAPNPTNEFTSDMEVIAACVREHFDHRWGQYPPVQEAEVRYLANVICSSLRTAGQCKDP